MIRLIKYVCITLFITTVFVMSANAESLFTLGAAQTYNATPKSLYGGVQARSVGDLISIIMDETVTATNNVTYTSDKNSTTVDRFSGVWNIIFNKLFGKELDPAFSTFGGSNTVENSAGSSNKLSFGNNIAVQVTQQLPNGNLIVQGKKTLVNANERVDLIVTGIVDPRWINTDGEVYSRYVANLQFAVNGRGSVSRSNNDGIINKFIKYLF